MTNKSVATEATSRAETQHDDQVAVSSSFTTFTPTPSPPPIASKPEVVHRERITLPSLATHRGSYRIPTPLFPQPLLPLLPVLTHLLLAPRPSQTPIHQRWLTAPIPSLGRDSHGPARDVRRRIHRGARPERGGREEGSGSIAKSPSGQLGAGVRCWRICGGTVCTEEVGEKEEKYDKDEEREGAASTGEDEREDKEETRGTREEEGSPSPWWQETTGQNGGEATSESLAVHPDKLVKEEEISNLQTEISTVRSERDQLQLNLLRS